MLLQVELLILSHHFYMSSSCLDGVDVLVTFAANRVDSYILEGDFTCLARLITGVSNFHSLSFILSILIENGQLDLLLQKYSSTDTATVTPASVRGFRIAVITSLKHFNPNDDEALSLVCIPPSLSFALIQFISLLTFSPETGSRSRSKSM
jgi:spatacsin